MMHLTAIFPASACAQPSAAALTDRTGCAKACNGHLASRCGELIFFRRVANFLEMRDVVLHYSVIGGQAMIDPAPGLADCHLLNDEAEAHPWVDAAGACAQAGEE